MRACFEVSKILILLLITLQGFQASENAPANDDPSQLQRKIPDAERERPKRNALAKNNIPSAGLIPTRRQLSAIMRVADMLNNMFSFARATKSAFSSASRRGIFSKLQKPSKPTTEGKKGKKKTFGGLAKQVISKISKASSDGLKQATKLFEKAKQKLTASFSKKKKALR